MRDSAVTGKTVCLDAATIHKCASPDELKQAVLAKLKVPAGQANACLELEGKALPRDKPLDIGMESATGPIMLTLSPQGLLGGA